jgi:hypothetical protein
VRVFVQAVREAAAVAFGDATRRLAVIGGLCALSARKAPLPRQAPPPTTAARESRRDCTLPLPLPLPLATVNSATWRAQLTMVSLLLLLSALLLRSGQLLGVRSDMRHGVAQRPGGHAPPFTTTRAQEAPLVARRPSADAPS